MCYGCYEEAGKPTIVNEDTIKASKLIAAIYEYNGVGANAHIVVDDWNVEDRHIDWCLTEALKQNVHESTPEQLEAERECLRLLRKLSKNERYSALAIHYGIIKEEVKS